MRPYLVRFEGAAELAQALLRIGASPESLHFFEARRESVQIYIEDVPAAAANVIKQEALSRGADAAVSSPTVACRVEKTDLILFGTAKQLRFLADKLATMPWWGLAETAAEIRRLLRPFVPRTIELPAGAELTFGKGTLIMGILNLTDDSFYAASRHGADAASAAERAVVMAADGADILDLGAESTRPGAERVPEEEERERLVKAVCAIRERLPRIPLSIDTTRASCARAALAAGADIINDVSGLTFEPQIADAAAEAGAMLVLMHMRGVPADMQSRCEYERLIPEICASLEKSAKQAIDAGIATDRIITDPGIGFAKNYQQNLALLRHVESFRALGWPVLIGASRKGFIGKATDTSTAAERLAGTIAAACCACRRHADIIRVHDVRAHKEAVMMTEAIENGEYV